MPQSNQRIRFDGKALEKAIADRDMPKIGELLAGLGPELIKRRGVAAGVAPTLAGRLQDGLSPIVGRPPTVSATAAAAGDGRLQRLVLARVTDADGRPARGVEIALRRDGAPAHAIADLARTDRRGLVLLRLPADRTPGRVADLPDVDLELLPAGGAPTAITIPAGAQTATALLSAGDLVGGLEDALGDAIEGLEGAIADVEAAGSVEGLATAGAAALDAATTSLQAAADALADVAGSATDAVDGTVEAALAAVAAAQAAVLGLSSTIGVLESVSTALGAALETLTEAALALVEEIPDDSVLGRLPVVFTTATAEAVVAALNAVQEGLPGLGPSVAGISSTRTPLIKRMAVRRAVYDPSQKRVRRFLVALRQEWSFLSFTLGRLVRVDALDPGTAVGTLDAELSARADAFASLDAATASALRAQLEAKLSAHASVDTVLDVAARADLDAKLAAAARAGVRRDQEPITINSVGEFFANLGDNLADALLPDIGAEANADLQSTLDVDSHTEFSLDSSFVAAGRLNAAATLTNQATVAVSAALGLSASLSARATASINPSLSRAVNLLRFELLENYAVTTAVDSIMEIDAEPVFKPPLPEDLFPPADVLEYRRLFEPRLLERRLARHFEVLRRGLEQMRRGGDPIESVRVRVEYGARPMSGADLSVTVAGHTRSVALRPGSSVVETVLPLGGPRLPREVDELRVRLAATLPQLPSFPGIPLPQIPPNMVGATVHRIELRFRPGDEAFVAYDALAPGASGFAVDGDAPNATLPGVALSPPELAVDLDTDPLVEHVRRNRHHYLGVLAEAALRRPALRLDAPQLANVDPDLWLLPLLGFEADSALTITEAPDDALRAQLEADEGTATIVQLAAAGLYTEAAQGSLAITDALGVLHPALSAVTPALDLATLGPLLAALAAQAGRTPGLPNIPTAPTPNGGALNGLGG